MDLPNNYNLPKQNIMDEGFVLTISMQIFEK